MMSWLDYILEKNVRGTTKKGRCFMIWTLAHLKPVQNGGGMSK